MELLDVFANSRRAPEGSGKLFKLFGGKYRNTAAEEDSVEEMP